MQQQQPCTYRCGGNGARYFSSVDAHHGGKGRNDSRRIVQAAVLSEQIWESEGVSVT